MQELPLTSEERYEILRRYHDALAGYAAALDLEDEDLAELRHDESRLLRAQYFRRLPRQAMACSPFNGKPLVRAFDPFGLDGLWWKSPAEAVNPPPGPYFCVLRGAVSARGGELHAGSSEIEPGPEVPYVIPRLLEHPGMVMVIGEIEMADGPVAFPLAYFAERRPPVADLTADWCLTEYLYTTATGDEGWKTPNDPWDFDLLTWLKSGKVRWCEPGSGNTVLATAPPEECPYLELEGVRAPLRVSREGVFAGSLPDGEATWPFE